MLLRHIYHRELAQASYLVGCAATGEALVVDPNRDIDQYIDLATREGLRVTAVTETHIHADFVSGARELAQRTGAQLYLSDMGTADWKYAYASEAGAILLRDGDTFKVGNILIEALHTPGHTPEHLAFLVTDTAGADAPMGIMTGDFVFVGDVGRPDLLEKAAGIAGSTEQAARDLFRSLQRFRHLSDYEQIWPGHGAGSACGRSLGAVPQSTVGYERRFNWAFGVEDESTFASAVLEGQPAAPVYFATMKRVNKEGPRPTSSLPAPIHLPHTHIERELEQGSTVIDLRPAESYAAGHIPGTLNLPLNTAFLTWAGWLVPYDRPIMLLGSPDEVRSAVRLLRLIGLDEITGFWTPDVLTTWQESGHRLGTFGRVTVNEALIVSEQSQGAVLDVRTQEEYSAGHIPGSQHIPLSELKQRLSEVPQDRPLLVHCQSGTRSPIAASILAAHGRTNVADLVAGYAAWRDAGLPTQRADEYAIAAAQAD